MDKKYGFYLCFSPVNFSKFTYLKIAEVFPFRLRSKEEEKTEASEEGESEEAMAAVGQQPPQRPPQTHSQQQTTQLEFNQAMRDFKTMFPEMDEDVIEVVLRANQGAVDATIDQLLAMSTDNENERIRTEMDATENAEAPPGYSPITPPPTYQQAVPYSQLSSQVNGNTDTTTVVVTTKKSVAVTKPIDVPLCTSKGIAASSVPLRVKKSWCPPLLGPLPCDFLRIAMPKGRSKGTLQRQQSNSMAATLCSEVIQQKIDENERQRKLSTIEDPELAQYLEDERIALFLQNEEFMDELRSNRDFLSTLERDDSDSDTEKSPYEAVGPFPNTKTSLPVPEESDAVFREKLKNMGKKSKRKFAHLARLFSRQKKRTAKQILSDGSMPSKDNLLLEEDDDSDDDPSQPQNEYHHIKNSSSPIGRHGGGGGGSSAT